MRKKIIAALTIVSVVACAVFGAFPVYAADIIYVTDVFSSDHPYQGNSVQTWIYENTNPGVTCVEITFSPSTHVTDQSDLLMLYDIHGAMIMNYTGNELAGKTVTVIGRGFRLGLAATSSGGDYGFDITAINGLTSASISGTSADSLTWSLDIASGVLGIDGTGLMRDYSLDWDPGAGYTPWFIYRNNISRAEIGPDITSIGANAFAACDTLRDITIGSGVISIGDWAFLGCERLEEVSFPDSVKKIGAYTFASCYGLISLLFGSGIEEIGEAAFVECVGLTAVDIPDTVLTLAGGAFYGCSALTDVVIGSGITAINEAAFSECSSLLNVWIPSGVTAIAANAFANCSGLTLLDIPETVNTIGEGAFSGCVNLTLSGFATSYAENFAAANTIEFDAYYLRASDFTSCIVNHRDNLIVGLEPGSVLFTGLIYTLDGYEIETLPTSNGFGTGTTVRVSIGGQSAESYTIVIFGDVTGDSNIDTGDASIISDFENFLIFWDPAADAELYEAADVNGDGNVDTSDADIIIDTENFLLSIDQRTGLFHSV